MPNYVASIISRTLDVDLIPNECVGSSSLTNENKLNVQISARINGEEAFDNVLAKVVVMSNGYVIKELGSKYINLYETSENFDLGYFEVYGIPAGNTTIAVEISGHYQTYRTGTASINVVNYSKLTYTYPIAWKTSYKYGENVDLTNFAVSYGYRLGATQKVLEQGKVTYDGSNFSASPTRIDSLSYTKITVVSNISNDFIAVGDVFNINISVSDNVYLDIVYSNSKVNIVDVNGLTITTDCFDSFVANVKSAAYGTILESNVSVTFDPSTISLNYALLHSEMVTAAKYTYNGNVLSKEVTVKCDFKRVISLDISGTDATTYYEGRSNEFALPSDFTYKKVYNDDTEVTLTSEEISSLTYWSAETGGVQLTDGNVMAENYTTIYVRLNVTDADNQVRVKTGNYSITYQTDLITTVAINNTVNFVLGNTLPHEKSKFTITANYTSGYTDTNFTNYEFVDDDTIILEPFSEDISIKLLASAQTSFYRTLSRSSIIYTYPLIESLRIVNLGATSLVNKLEGFDYTNMKIIASFVNATYEKEYELDSADADDEYSISPVYSDSTAVTVTDYEGTPLEVPATKMPEGWANITVTFTVKNPFYLSDSTKNKTIDVEYKIFDLINITGIGVSNPYTDYKVGETFPKAADNTMITIYWEQEVNGNAAFVKKDVELKSGFASLSIQPYNEELRTVNYTKTIKISSVLNSAVYTTYDIQVKPKELLDDETTLVLSAYLENGELLLKDPNMVERGKIVNAFDPNKNARVVLYDDYLPLVDGSANIEVTFPSYHEGEADKINNCHFGCLFGANNAVNRLFVSGNREIGNADWHTAELNLTDYEGEIEINNGNFSYIPSESVMYYGETDNAICGYEIVSNDKLLVLKSKSDKEKTVYFRTPTLLKALDSSGNEQTDINGETLVQEEFSLVKGNNSVAGISPKSILNLNGDLLFVSSDNEVVGLDLVGIVGDNQRYANSRSKTIDKKLHELDLSDCTFWTNNKYAFLSIKDYGLFVTHFEARTESQYEWWYLTSNNPTTFIEIDDEIYIGNDDGSFSRLFNGTWRDVKKLFINQDQTVLIDIYPDGEEIGIDSSIVSKMENDVDYKFRSIEEDDYKMNLYYKIADMRAVPDQQTDLLINGTDEVLEIVTNNESRKEELLKTLAENREYYINYIEEDIVGGAREIDCDDTTVNNPFIDCFGKPFKLEKVLEGDSDYDASVERYRLMIKSGNNWVQTTVGRLHNGRLCEKLVYDVDIVELNRELNRFKLSSNGNIIDIVQYGKQDTQRIARAEIREYRNVDALYITAPLLANSLNTFKTVWQVTMTNDTDIDSALQVCIASNKVPYSSTKQLETAGRLGVDLNAFAFFDVDYDKVVVPRTYTINRTLPMQKFLCFGFRNKSGYNAVLSEMAVTYTLPFPSYGSD